MTDTCNKLRENGSYPLAKGDISPETAAARVQKVSRKTLFAETMMTVT